MTHIWCCTYQRKYVVFEITRATPTLKPQSNGPLYSNTVIGTLAVDGWAVTFGTARRGLGGPGPRLVPPLCTECHSLPINGQCTVVVVGSKEIREVNWSFAISGEERRDLADVIITH